MIDKLSAQQRLLLAGILSILVFLGSQMYMQSKYPPKKNELSSTNQTKVATPNVANKPAPISNQAPLSSTTEATKPPLENDTKKHIVIVKSKHFEAEIDELGRIDKYTLNDDKFLDKDGKKIQLIKKEFSLKPLEIRFTDTNLNNESFKTPYTSNESTVQLDGDKKSIKLTQKLSSLTITKNITFYPDGNYDISIELTKPSDFFITPGARPDIAADGYTFHGIIVQEADGTLEVLDDGDVDSTMSIKNSPMISASDRYYTTLFYNYNDGLNAIISKGTNGIDNVFVKSSQNIKFSGYIGPKDHKILSSINPKLTDAIEYGWFTFIAKPVFSLLNYIHGILGNWGWAIVAMTFLIRLVLFPLTYKGMVSMNKLKELSPKIKELQAKYKGEPQKLNTHMMELYKKHGANPMGGCLPILLQIPVFFAIYRVLQNAVELKDAPWILWIKDLSVMDPLYILPIAMGVTMFIHQRLTPTNFTDPTQEKIMKFLPLIFTFFFVTFPSGLTLYWFVNNIFSIIQQMYVNSIFAKKKETQKVNTK